MLGDCGVTPSLPLLSVPLSPVVVVVAIRVPSMGHTELVNHLLRIIIAIIIGYLKSYRNVQIVRIKLEY